ncbi:MAG: short-chain dehydrogenase [Rhodospirillaceae bacterium]|nr:short-chain dehydrogenase [Rhodospirillaceae bacterium]
MDLGLRDKTALVTGGSKGIGRAVALALAEEGCHLHLAARTQADLDAVKAEIGGRHNVSVTVHAVDLSNGDAVRALAADCGNLDILVNNAGAIPGGDLQAIDEPTWRAAWDLKVFGYINLSRAVYAQMKADGHGTIVNVIGLAGERPDAKYIAGSTGNAGLMHFTRALGGHAPADNIRVVAVNPGLVATDRMEFLLRKRATDSFGDAERWREFLTNLPFGRAATSEEVANAVVFLASPRASYISGTILTIDGGIASRAG